MIATLASPRMAADAVFGPQADMGCPAKPHVVPMTTMLIAAMADTLAVRRLLATARATTAMMPIRVTRNMVSARLSANDSGSITVSLEGLLNRPIDQRNVIQATASAACRVRAGVAATHCGGADR